MKKLNLIVMVSLLGCNYGSSIADQSTGGSTPAGSGGSSGAGDNLAAGGSSSSQNGGSGATSNGGGGSTGNGSGGTAAASGGAVAVGGSNGSGGSKNADAGNTGGAAGAGTGGGAVLGGSPGGGGTASSGGTVGSGGTIAGSGGVSGTGGSTSACVPAATPASLAKVHNAGKDCIACHGSKVPTTIAGTLYDKSGTAALSGATVTITGKDGKVLKLVTASNGNFWSDAAVSFPAEVEVSKCPDTAAMADTISAGSCNSCHKSGGAAPAIHLP